MGVAMALRIWVLLLAPSAIAYIIFLANVITSADQALMITIIRPMTTTLSGMWSSTSAIRIPKCVNMSMPSTILTPGATFTIILSMIMLALALISGTLPQVLLFPTTFPLAIRNTGSVLEPIRVTTMGTRETNSSSL